MPGLPKRPARGQDILPWAQQVNDFLASLMPRGVGVRFGSAGVTVRQPTPVEVVPVAASRRERRFFQLLSSSTGGTPSAPRLRVTASTLAGLLPTTPAADPATGDYYLAPDIGTRYVYARLTINGSTGAKTAVALVQDASPTKANTDTQFHVLIGSYSFDGEKFTGVGNFRYGPIDASICRLKFEAEPTWSVTFSGGLGG